MTLECDDASSLSILSIFICHPPWHQGPQFQVKLKDRKNLKRRCIVALQKFADRKRDSSHLLDRLDAEQLEATGEYAGGQVGQFQAAGSKLRCFRVSDGALTIIIERVEGVGGLEEIIRQDVWPIVERGGFEDLSKTSQLDGQIALFGMLKNDPIG